MKFEVRNGCFCWNAGRRVLSNVHFSVGEGEVLAVLGPNGIGKTTLLRASMGFLNWTDGGSYIDGRDIREFGQKELWKGISYVPQAKFPSFALTAIDMTVLGRNPYLRLLSSPGEEDYRMAESVLERLGISHLRDVAVNRMSGGELQMVLIARALVSEPRLLILDEPESNLDFANQLRILHVIRELAEKDGISCIFNTHYPQHAYRIAHKALLLGRDGRNIFGKVEEILTEQNIRDFFSVESRLHRVEDEAESWMTITPLHLVKEEGQ
ncbi:MAG: ABC transporter ATP-binding protein [Bacillota bacterium]|nr:ABC transporter ATP-binding protein [Bacillota bacterium]